MNTPGFMNLTSPEANGDIACWQTMYSLRSPDKVHDTLCVAIVSGRTDCSVSHIIVVPEINVVPEMKI